MLYSELEEKFGIIIPDDFKLFQKLIELNNPIIKYVDPFKSHIFRLTKWLVYKDSHIRVDDFFNSSSLEIDWGIHKEIWGSLDYLPFGTLTKPHSGVLLYKNLEEGFGTIYYTETGSREPMYLAPDLFSFVEAMKIEFRDDKENIIPKLYKNWGEDFWRVREERAPNKES